MVTGFTFLSRLTEIAPPHTRFVFLGAGIRLGLPSHPASRRRSCLRLGVSITSSSRGLSPPIDRPCRAYSRAAPLRGTAGLDMTWLGAACALFFIDPEGLLRWSARADQHLGTSFLDAGLEPLDLGECLFVLGGDLVEQLVVAHGL